MSERGESILGHMRDDLGSLGREAGEMLRLRWELARLELAEDFARLKRLLIVLVIAGTLVLSGLPVLVVAAADALDGAWGLGRTAWLLVFGAAMIFVGAVSARAAWTWFRRNLVALRETIAELEEDRLWLEEWPQAP